MQTVPQWAKATVLCAFGLGAMAVGNWLLGTAFLAGGLVIFLPGLVGRDLGSAADADAMVYFVRDPVGSLVDRAVAETKPAASKLLSDLIGQGEPEQVDIDAAFASYLARREVPPANPPQPATGRPSFGRKQA